MAFQHLDFSLVYNSKCSLTPFNQTISFSFFSPLYSFCFLILIVENLNLYAETAIKSFDLVFELFMLLITALVCNIAACCTSFSTPKFY